MPKPKAAHEPDVIELILALHKKDGTRPISKIPGLWYRKVDRQWEFWVNGHMKPQAPADGSTQKINPGDCFVKYNGWPAGIFSLITGEGVLCAGTMGNYENFRKALKEALK